MRVLVFVVLAFASCVLAQTVLVNSRLFTTIPGASGFDSHPLSNGEYLAVSTSSSTHQVFAVNQLGQSFAIAGTGSPGYVDGPASTAQFNQPTGALIGRHGEVYVADSGNGAVRVVFGGQVETVSKNFTAPTLLSGSFYAQYRSPYYDDDDDYYSPVNTVQMPYGLYVGDGDDVVLLSVSPKNDECPQAVDLGKMFGIDLFAGGSNRYASADGYICTDDDDDSYSPNSGVWYTFVGNGDRVQVQEIDDVGADMRVFVFRERDFNSATCENLVCMGTREGPISFCTQDNMRYYVVVSGHHSYDWTSFTIMIGDEGPSTCSECNCPSSAECGSDSCGGSCGFDNCTPDQICNKNNQCKDTAPNAQCSGAIELTDGASVVVDTHTVLEETRFNYIRNSCGGTPEGDGVWYKTTGTGTHLIASTCTRFTSIDTRMWAFIGNEGCDRLSCVDQSDDDCDHYRPSASTVSWCASADSEYYIYTEPYDTAGTIGLTLTDSGVACGLSGVDDAEQTERKSIKVEKEFTKVKIN